MDVVKFLSDWYKKPFNSDGSVLNWALFVLLIIVLCGVWANILSYLRPIAKAAAEAV